MAGADWLSANQQNAAQVAREMPSSDPGASLGKQQVTNTRVVGGRNLGSYELSMAQNWATNYAMPLSATTNKSTTYQS